MKSEVVREQDFEAYSPQEKVMGLAQELPEDRQQELLSLPEAEREAYMIKIIAQLLHDIKESGEGPDYTPRLESGVTHPANKKTVQRLVHNTFSTDIQPETYSQAQEAYDQLKVGGLKAWLERKSLEILASQKMKKDHESLN